MVVSYHDGGRAALGNHFVLFILQPKVNSKRFGESNKKRAWFARDPTLKILIQKEEEEAHAPEPRLFIMVAAVAGDPRTQEGLIINDLDARQAVKDNNSLLVCLLRHLRRVRLSTGGLGATLLQLL